MSTDNDIISRMLFDFNKGCKIDAAGGVNNPACSFTTTVNGAARASNTDDDMFRSNMGDYFEQTSDIIILNDFKNTNTYLMDVMGSEKERSTRLKQKTVNQVHKMRQAFLMRRYRIAYNLYVTNIIQFTLFVVVVGAVCFGMSRAGIISSGVAFAISLSLLATYLLILMIVIKNHQTRRKDDWNKFYFPSIVDETQSKCPSTLATN